MKKQRDANTLNHTKECNISALGLDKTSSFRKNDLQRLLSTPPYPLSNKNRRYMLKMIYLDKPLMSRRKRVMRNPINTAVRHSKSPVNAHNPMPPILFPIEKSENKENSFEKTDIFSQPSKLAFIVQNSRNLNNRVQTAHYSFLNKSGPDSSSVLQSKEVRLRQVTTQKAAMKHYISTRGPQSRGRQNGLRKAQSTRKNGKKEIDNSPYTPKIALDKSQQLFISVKI